MFGLQLTSACSRRIVWLIDSAPPRFFTVTRTMGFWIAKLQPAFPFTMCRPQHFAKAENRTE